MDNWIHISNPPEKFEEVIICSDEGRRKSAIYMGDGKWNTFLRVEWWMPFPDAPKRKATEVVTEDMPKKRGRKKKV